MLINTNIIKCENETTHPSIRDSLFKHNENDPFLKRIIGRWKMDCLHQYGTKKILGKTIWATINRFKGRPASEEGDAVYLIGRVLRTPSTQPNDKFGQILFPIRPIKGSNRWKAGIGKSEGCSIRTTLDLTSRCIPGKNWYNLARMSYLTRHIHTILHLQITTYSGPYRIPLMKRTSILWKPVKTTWSSSSPRKIPSSGRIMKLLQRWKRVEQNDIYVIE